MDGYLQSTESLDRASPELWPERNSYAVCQELLAQGGGAGLGSALTSAGSPSPVHVSDQDFNPQDIKLFHEYAGLSPSQMVDVVKQLQNVAYLLGLEEAKEMRRGKYLNILRRRPQL